MGAGLFCVAGWCAAANRMVRPLPNGGNWPKGLLTNKGISPGVTLGVTALNQPITSAYPHRTEDTPIDPMSAQVVHPGPQDWFGVGAPPLATTLQEAFEGNVHHNSEWNGRRQSVYVPANAVSRSLWGVGISRDDLDLVEDWGKLKAHINDGQHNYMVSVSSKGLKEAFRLGGIVAANASLPLDGKLHVRMGLARPWHAHPEKCYAMINGVHW